MESNTWRMVWRNGFAPSLSNDGLLALRDALRGDDPRLVQGATTSPPPLLCVQDWPVDGCCALGFCGWQGDGLMTVGEVEAHFAKCCYEADRRLGEPAACRWFLNWFDDTPRSAMRKDLLNEVERELSERGVDRDEVAVPSYDRFEQHEWPMAPVNRLAELIPVGV